MPRAGQSGEGSGPSRIVSWLCERLWSQTATGIPVLPLSGCETPGKRLNLSRPLSPVSKMANNGTAPYRAIRGIKGHIGSSQVLGTVCLARRKCSVTARYLVY